MLDAWSQKALHDLGRDIWVKTKLDSENTTKNIYWSKYECTVKYEHYHYLIVKLHIILHWACCKHWYLFTLYPSLIFPSIMYPMSLMVGPVNIAPRLGFTSYPIMSQIRMLDTLSNASLKWNAFNWKKKKEYRS